MLANVTHSPAWRNQGYVCLACRRQRVLALHRHQRRFNSEVAAQPSSTADSWFDGLNDISDMYSSKPSDKASKANKKAKTEEKASPKESKPASSSRDGQQHESVEALSSKTGKVSSKPKVKKKSLYTEPDDAQGLEGRRKGWVKWALKKDVGAAGQRGGSVDQLMRELREDAVKKTTPMDKDRLIGELRRTVKLAAERQDEDLGEARQNAAGRSDKANKDARHDDNGDGKSSDGQHIPEETPDRRCASLERKQPLRLSNLFHYNLRLSDLFHYRWRPSRTKESEDKDLLEVSMKERGPASLKASKSTFASRPESLQDLWSSLNQPTAIVADVADRAEALQRKASDNEQLQPLASEEASSTESTSELVQQASVQGQEQIDEPNPAQVRLAGLHGAGHPGLAETQNLNQTPEGGSRHYSTKTSSIARKGGSGDAPKGIKEAMTPMFRPSAQRSQPAQGAESSSDDPPDDPEPEETPATAEIMSIEPSSIEVTPLDIPQPPVPYLEYGLDRVLFNPGVYQLQDPASRVYNFDPYLQKIMPVTEFDFDSLKEYKTSSEDQALAKLAREQGKKYIGSTSSMTSSLAHFHYLLSNWRPVNLDMLSDQFVRRTTPDNFTEINRAPSAIFLRWKNGTYAIDADKEYDSANVLMLLGKSMELLLTLPKSDYERYRKSDPRQVSEDQKTAPESYQYTTMRDFLMRSQLDAYDPRLPGNGTFDLKTRAVVSVRMQAQDFEPMTGYEIHGLQGKWSSYEREYYDMMRATMLKYMLQARMGRMNGIFVAYHNVKRMFGFQYIPMHDMDRSLHGQTDTCLGDQEFKASLEIMNELFNKATAKFPGRSMRFHFETRPQQDGGMPTALHVFGEPMSEEEIDRIQNSQKAKVQEFESNIMGKNNEAENATASESAAKEPEVQETQAPQKTKEGSHLLSTNSNADESFLSSISSDEAGQELKELFYATVIVQSKVNGETLKNDRPEKLKPEEKWEIDYILKEYEITRHEWALYNDCRARRKYALTERDDEDGADAESEGKVRQGNGFINLLRGMAAKGKAFRDRIDESEAGMEVVRADVPLPRERERIEDVEDYMKWMYEKK